MTELYVAAGIINFFGFGPLLTKMQEQESSSDVSLPMLCLVTLTGFALAGANHGTHTGAMLCFAFVGLGGLAALILAASYRNREEQHIWIPLGILAAVAWPMGALGADPVWLGVIGTTASVLRNVPQVIKTWRAETVTNLSPWYFVINVSCTSAVLIAEILGHQNTFNIFNFALVVITGCIQLVLQLRRM